MTRQEIISRIDELSHELFTISTYAGELTGEPFPMKLTADLLKHMSYSLDSINESLQ